MNRKRILVTGGAGAVGTETLRELVKSSGYLDVTVLDLPGKRTRRVLAPFADRIRFVAGSVDEIVGRSIHGREIGSAEGPAGREPSADREILRKPGSSPPSALMSRCDGRPATAAPAFDRRRLDATALYPGRFPTPRARPPGSCRTNLIRPEW